MVQGIFISYGSACKSSTWATGADPISQDLREVVKRVQVDKGVKVFSTGDEFLLHCFQSHLLANICKQLGVENPSDAIPMHDITSEWLEQTATTIVRNTFFRADSKDSQYSFHQSFLRAAYHYIDLRNAIKHRLTLEILAPLLPWKWLQNVCDRSCKFNLQPASWLP